MSARIEKVVGGLLLTATEVAQLADVTPSAVSNWRKRFSDFPVPAGTAPSGGDLFLLADVQRWLEEHNRARKGAGREATEQLWAVADRLRGRALAGDLIGVVAAGAVLLDLARERGQLPSFHRQDPEETANWTRGATNQLETERPELGGLFAPLTVVDSQSLRLLLDSLVSFESSEELAAAIDVVIERGMRYGEFRTPQPVAALLAELAEPHGVVFDPAVGSGEFLIQAAQVTVESPELYGQEINESVRRIALARLLLRHLDPHIALGDSLSEDRYPHLEADIVLCEPPAGARTADLSSLAGDPRWQLLGSFEAPPTRASDFTWLAHVLHHLAATGRGYVLLPRGSLFRKGVEGRFRAELIRQGIIEAIVALPAGSLAGTTIPPVLWIVRPPTRTPDDVLLIDASTESGISAELRSRLVATVHGWRNARADFEPSPGFATNVPVLELLAGEASLVPSRWLYEPELVDANVLIAGVEQAQHALVQAHAKLERHSPQLTLIPTDEPPTRLRVRDLIDLGGATLLRPARVKTEQFGGEGLPVWLPADVREPWRRDEQPRFVDPALVDSRSVTEPGDIVLTTVGGLRTRVDEEGGHVLGTSLHALRLKHELFDAYVVAALLASEPNRRLLTGTTIPRVDLLELEIPRLDAATAARAAKLLRALADELEWAHAVVAHAEDFRKEIVDALATGATRIDDISEADGDRRGHPER